jgi:hypothetical protein
VIGEVNLFGVFVPPLLIWGTVALAISLPLRWALSRLGVYNWVWHRGLFDFCLVVILWAVTASAAGSVWPGAPSR